jgi:hypothetical protein
MLKDQMVEMKLRLKNLEADRFISKSLEEWKMEEIKARSGATNLARNALVGNKLLVKVGQSSTSWIIRPILKRLPIIGALIDFGFLVALGEDPGRAAFRAIGAVYLELLELQ